MFQVLIRLALPWSLAATAGFLAATASTMVSVALLTVVMLPLTGAGYTTGGL